MSGESGNGDGTATIQLVVKERGDEAALARLLEGDYEVITGPEIVAADCYIFDVAMLPRYVDALIERKRRATPVFLPVLLIQRESVPIDIDGLEARAEDVIVIDEFIHAPVSGSVLDRRIENLLTRRRQSESLQSDYQRMRRAVFSSGVAIYITDTEGTIEYVNPAFEEVTGYDKEEALGQTPGLLNSGEMTEGYFEDLWDTVTAGEVWKEEVINRRKSGETYVAEQTIAPVTGPDGAIEGFVAIQQDVTERKRERQELREYRQAVEASSELLAAIDLELQYLFANDAYLEYHGMDDSPVAERSLREVLGPEGFADIEPAIDAAMNGQRVQIETTRVHPDRGERTLDAKLFPIRNDEGTIRGVGTSMRDVTERNRHERQLQTLISNLPGVVYRCTNEWGWPMEMVRGQCEQLTGYSAASIRENEVSWGEDIIHPDDRQRVWESIQDAVRGDEPFEVTYRIRTAGGETRWVWERGRVVSPLGDDAAKLEGFVTDISDQKALERELRDARDRYESLFNSIQDAILVADTDRRIINCNTAFTEQFGYELSEIEGKPTSYVYASTAEFERMGEEIAAHMDDWSFTYTIDYQTKSGTVFPGETSAFYLTNADGDVAGFIGVIRDISERKQRLQQLQMFDRILQHKFHNDMTVIEGNIDLAAASGGPAVEPHLRTALESSTDLRHTIDKEREITKFLTDPPPVESVDLRSVLRQSVEQVSTAHPNATVTVDVPETAAVRANLAISRALEELLNNAIVHTAADSPRVAVRTRIDGEGVTIEIADDGPPIPEMERTILSGDREIGPLYHGSGLGLWLVQVIVAQSDGTLGFAVTDEGGNLVTVRLPRASPDA